MISTPQELVAELEEYYGKPQPPKVRAEYCRMLERFHSSELQRIYDRVLVGSRYWPKIAELYGAAEELGYLSKIKPVRRPVSDWTPTDCGLCKGYGALSVFKGVTLEEDGRMCIRERKSLPANAGAESHEYHMAHPHLYEYFYRCVCERGDRHPAEWPVYRAAQEMPA